MLKLQSKAFCASSNILSSLKRCCCGLNTLECGWANHFAVKRQPLGCFYYYGASGATSGATVLINDQRHSIKSHSDSQTWIFNWYRWFVPGLSLNISCKLLEEAENTQLVWRNNIEFHGTQKNCDLRDLGRLIFTSPPLPRPVTCMSETHVPTAIPNIA